MIWRDFWREKLETWQSWEDVVDEWGEVACLNLWRGAREGVWAGSSQCGKCGMWQSRSNFNRLVRRCRERLACAAGEADAEGDGDDPGADDGGGKRGEGLGIG